MNKRIFIHAAVLVPLLVGCTQTMVTPAAGANIISVTPTVIPTLPPTAIPRGSVESIDLQVGGKRVSLTFVQNGETIPVTVNRDKHAAVSLAPDTFTIRVDGDKWATSIVGYTDEGPLLSIERYARPLATFDVGNPVLENNDLRLFGPPFEFTDDLETFFTTYWCRTCPERVPQLVDYLKGKLGTEPLMLFSGRLFPDDRTGESDFTIRTINGIQPTIGQTLLITVFLQDDIGEGFYQLEWFTFHISFVAQ